MELSQLQQHPVWKVPVAVVQMTEFLTENGKCRTPSFSNFIAFYVSLVFLVFFLSFKCFFNLFVCLFVSFHFTGLSSEGIFRVPGSVPKVEALKAKFDKGIFRFFYFLPQYFCLLNILPLSFKILFAYLFIYLFIYVLIYLFVYL